MTDRLRMAALRKADTRVLCPGCAMFVPLSAIQFDHHLALVDGGKHDEENVRVLCSIICHKNKSAREHVANCKGKRVAKAQEIHKAVVDRVMTRQPGKIKSRGFSKVHRPFRRSP